MNNNFNLDFTKSNAGYLQLLSDKGFRQYAYGQGESKSFKLIRVKDRMIGLTTKEDLQKTAFDEIKKLDDPYLARSGKEDLLKNIDRFTTNGKLMSLSVYEPNFLQDTKNESYIFFENGVVKATPKETFLIKYEHIEHDIWESEKKNRPFWFVPIEEIVNNCEFYHFICKITKTSNPDESYQRYNRLTSLMGYLVHRYQNPANAKAVVLMDGSLNNQPSGGSGKGLIIKALNEIRKTTIEDGKHFNQNSNFAFQQLKPDTKIYTIDDVGMKFDFESFFALITEGIVIEQKYEAKIRIPFADSPKIVITTNYAIQGNGDSFKRRIEEFDLTKHYSAHHTPINEFGHLFFDEWDDYQWNLFYNLMVNLVSVYLQTGIEKHHSSLIDQKKLQMSLPSEFVEFAQTEVYVNTEYEKSELFQLFKNQYPNHNFTQQNTFSSWVAKYASLTEYELSTRHSGSNNYFTFIDQQPKQTSKIE